MDTQQLINALHPLFVARVEIDKQIERLLPGQTIQVLQHVEMVQNPSQKKKRKYTRHDPKTPLLDDPIGQRSSCCGKQVIVVGGDEGTNHYECTSCGEACDTETGKPQPVKYEPKKKRKISKGCEGCGSPSKHKKDCPIKYPGKGMKSWLCDDCGHEFEAPSDFDGKCPGCGKENVWPNNGAI